MRVIKFDNSTDVEIFADAIHYALKGDKTSWDTKYPLSPLPIIQGQAFPNYNASRWISVDNAKSGTLEEWAVQVDAFDSRIDWLMITYPNYMANILSVFGYEVSFEEVPNSYWKA